MILAGKRIKASDFIATSTGVPDAAKGVKLDANGKLDASLRYQAIVRRWFKRDYVPLGDSTSRFDLVYQGGTTWRYTWDGTGTNPNISAASVPVGTLLDIQAQNFNAADKGLLVVTGSGSSYFEVDNAGGVGGLDLTIGTGYIRIATPLSYPIETSNTQFDITKSGSTVRYTWDGTGTDPRINTVRYPVGTVISIQGQNFNAANKVISKITAVGLNYFEITNASGVAENDKTIGNGFIATGFLWTKPTNLVALYLAGIGGGGQGDQSTSNPDNDAGGGAAAVAEAFFTAAELAASEYYVIPGLGGKGFPTTQTQHVGTPSSFGTQTLTLVRADGATGRIGATTGLIPTNGILTPGQDGENANSSRGSGMGAQSRWGKGGQPANNSQNPGAGYGSGGSGGTTNSTTDVAGGDGAPGMWDFTEIY